MGLHSPFGYVHYEETMLKTLIQLVDDYCTSCHTDQDYNEGCKGCPVGSLIYNCREYLLDVYITPYDKCEYQKKYNETLLNIRKSLKRFKPHPGFNSTWILQDAPTKDKLAKLRWYLRELDYYSSQMSHPFLKKEWLEKSKEHKEEELRKLPRAKRMEAIKKKGDN